MNLTITEKEPIAVISYSDLNPTVNNSTNASNLSNTSQSNKTLTEEKFNECLIQAIDEVISSLGAPVKNQFYYRLEQDFKISKTNIPENIEEFSDVLHRIFGLGACRLELKFLQRLHLRIQANTNWPECDYTVPKWIEMEVSFIKTIGFKRRQCLAC